MSKIVFITGASSGIGKVSAEYLSAKGYKVYGTSRNPKSNGFTFSLLEMELNDKDSITKAINYIIEKEGRIDVLVNNAGTGITGPVQETPADEIRKYFDINFIGIIEVIQSVLKPMIKQKSGLIINITSLAGYTGLPFRGVYSASKSALEIITESMRLEVRDFGVEMCNIAPGDFATNIESRRYHAPLIKNSVYRDAYKHNLDLMNKHVKTGRNPVEIAQKIYKIINTSNPNIHYKVGDTLQKFSINIKRILPDKLYEKLILKYYKM